MSSFKDLRILDNFYQTSAYYPMPTVLVTTLAEVEFEQVKTDRGLQAQNITKIK